MSDDTVKALEAEKKELMESLLYAKAELANLRRVMENEVRRSESAAVERIMRKLLPFYEDFERVVRGLSAESVNPTVYEAVIMLFKELENLLQSEGLEKMDVMGKEFNPFDHEAVEFIESSDVSVETVVEVVSPGYKLHNRILKPPKVKVAKPYKPP
ncbi:MAG: nucleotide exchange factor GrpE [Candidatus Caldarchaeum sp.]|nr:nucleotide exchange factor GrpE [Candidatus Caldarchaeum sp.]MDW7977858.1 nucleotide exchange factor GrpE [Candidatus Caldarchaeum sp.]MDW8359782.1 nucleotide exchange factor GrpE [Candidatus Caldarchaeum sp.]